MWSPPGERTQHVDQQEFDVIPVSCTRCVNIEVSTGTSSLHPGLYSYNTGLHPVWNWLHSLNSIWSSSSWGGNMAKRVDVNHLTTGGNLDPDPTSITSQKRHRSRAFSRGNSGRLFSAGSIHELTRTMPEDCLLNLSYLQVGKTL